jgi:retinol-binding protein 3
MRKITTMLCIAVLGAFVHGQAQNKPQPVTASEKKEVVETINKLLIANYIYPQMTDKIVNFLSTNLKKGNYNSVTDPFEFADKLTADLVAVSNDRHFIIQLDPDWVKDSKQAISTKDSLEMVKRDISEFRKDNFGFKDVKILSGNIGYMNLIGFCPTRYAGETAVAALSFLSNTDAIIIDLRQNGGGNSDMVQLLASYFFDETPRVLVGFYDPKTNLTEQDYNLQYLPGKRMPDKNVYILTSRGTFSAAESFTYMMKNRKRATIVGENTGGGAHSVDREIVNDRFAIRIPASRPIDPITKTDWEGVGVAPDIAVSVKDALVAAQIKALGDLGAKTNTNQAYLWEIDVLKGRQNPVIVDAVTLKAYAGKYGQRNIVFEDGSLYFQKGAGEKHKLIPIGHEVFLLEDIDDMKIKMVVENGKAIALNRLFDNGDSRVEKRDE